MQKKLPGTLFGRSVRARLWIEGSDGSFLGIGKVKGYKMRMAHPAANCKSAHR